MEHKLITGDGATWLPFARSRIKALLATGASHAAQRFTMPDGALLSIRIEPRHEYIKIDGGGGSMYMDTGDLKVKFPGASAPDRLDPSKLNFMDIGVDGDYLGEINLSESKFGQQTAKQKETRPMVQMMDSLAIGWKSPTDAEVEEAGGAEKWAQKKKEEMENASVAKKVVIGNFPASLWTGKMRLFMQAQYGMPLESENFGFFPDIVGTELVIKYRNETSETEWQPGYWTHKSAGVFTADDGTYWIIDITRGDPTRLTTFVVYAYELKSKGNEAKLLKKKLKTISNATEKSKVEAYLFSISYIDLANRITCGFFDPAPRGGSGMSYGWKFNTAGDKASIVLVGVGGGYGDLHFKSTTVHLNFSYTAADLDRNKPASFSVSGTKTDHPDWMDGWGYFNMFTPESETQAGPLALFSLAVSRDGLRSITQFGLTAVYGYYIDDVWNEVKVKRRPTTGIGQVLMSTNGLEFAGREVIVEEFIPAASGDHIYGFGRCGAGWSAYYKQSYSSAHMDVEFLGFSLDGAFDTGVRNDTIFSAGGGGTPGGFLGIPVAYDVLPSTTPGGWSGTAGTGSEGASNYIPGETISGLIALSVIGETNSWIYTYTDLKLWTILIPAYDAEAVNIATRVREIATAPTHTRSLKAVTSALRPVGTAGNGTFYRPWYRPGDEGGFASLPGFPTSETDNIPPPKPDTISIECFNRANGNGVSGVPGHHPGLNYETVFAVDKDYPVIAAGMQTYASYNKRWWGSEEPDHTPGLVGGARFIGWA